MTTYETRRYEMLTRVREFGDTHRELFPESSLGSQAFAVVDAAVKELNEHSRVRQSKRREGQAGKKQARQALVAQLEAIGRTARVIGEESPGFDDPFRLPQRPSDQALLTTGRVFVHDAEASKGQFVSHGMPDTFVADLHALVEEYEQGIRSREAGKDGHVAARAGIEAAFASALAAVRKLDVIVANQLHDDPVTMAVWERDRRVEYGKRMRRVAREQPAAGSQQLATPSGSPPVSEARSVAVAAPEVTP